MTGRTANQLETLDAIGILSGGLPDVPGNLDALANPLDAGQTDEDRARAYLHANCANCHRPGGPTPSAMDLQYATNLADAGICDVDPASGDLGITDARIVAPGDPDRSVMISRIERRDGFGMPPLGSHIVDSAGAAVLRSWVSGLTTCP